MAPTRVTSAALPRSAAPPSSSSPPPPPSSSAADFRRVLRRLQQRPDVLLSNLSRVDAQLEELCLKDYHVHIQNHQCLLHARRAVAEMAASTTEMRALVPGMRAVCGGTGTVLASGGPSGGDGFAAAAATVEAAAAIAARHALNQKTLAQHNRLLELLEVPQLMDTCVRKGQHRQAVQLLAFANTLERKHSARGTAAGSGMGMGGTVGGSGGGGGGSSSRSASLGNVLSGGGGGGGATADGSMSAASSVALSARVVESIIDDVRRSAVGLRTALLRSLRQDVKLPECLATMTFLKRVERLLAHARFLEPDVRQAVRAFDLRRDFLRNRDEWLARALRGVVPGAGGGGTGGADDPFRFLMAVVDRSRELWYDVMTQFRAVFEVRVAAAAATAPATAGLLTADGGGGGAGPGGGDDGGEGEAAAETATLLAGWVALRVRELHATLRHCLPHIRDLAEVARALDQCMYFGTSLGRLGADFRALLLPTFEAHVEDLLHQRWHHAIELFSDDLAAMAASAPTVFIAEESITPFAGAGAGAAHPAPPNWYLAFPPLANLANAVLMSLNDLRHAALLSLKLPLARAFQRLVLSPAAASAAALLGRSPDSFRQQQRQPLPPTQQHQHPHQQRDAGRLRAHHRLLCLALFRHAAPYFASCFLSVFGDAAAAPAGAGGGAGGGGGGGAAAAAASAGAVATRKPPLPPLFSVAACAAAFEAALPAARGSGTASLALPADWLESLAAVAREAADAECAATAAATAAAATAPAGPNSSSSGSDADANDNGDGSEHAAEASVGFEVGGAGEGDGSGKDTDAGAAEVAVAAEAAAAAASGTARVVAGDTDEQSGPASRGGDDAGA